MTIQLFVNKKDINFVLKIAIQMEYALMENVSV